MGQLNHNLPENSDTGERKATEALLSSMTQELENLKQNLLAQLNQDVERLQQEKSRLRQEIDNLEQERQRQIAQQQQMARQLAQSLTAQLQEQLMQQLNQMASTSQATEYNDNAYKLLASLDATLRTTFKTLQQDINSYQSSLSQQLSHMHSMEQQGEAILETLVERLGEQFQGRGKQASGADRDSNLSARYQNGVVSDSFDSQQSADSLQPSTQPPAALIKLESPKEKLSQVQLGFILVLFSTIALSIHNVIVRIVGNQSNLFGIDGLFIGGFIKLGLGNSLLILWIRMIVVVPLLAIVAKSLYPPVWMDVKRVITEPNRGPLLSAIASGFCLFLSQVLIYIAIGDIGPGVAVTILFMYPIITVPVAWLLFRDRPSLIRIGVTIVVALGVILTALPNISSTSNFSLLGVGTAVVSGIGFAFYIIFIQVAFQKKIAPIPVSLIQFATIFVLCSLSLMLPFSLGVQVLPSKQVGLLIGGAILGTLTLAGYLLNNFAVRFMGAAKASIVSSMGPAMTAILAFLIIPGPRTALKEVQWMGILLVTLAIGALSFEKLQQTKQIKR